jgi:hypothetical protein
MVDAGGGFVIGEDPPEDAILRRGVLYRWKGSKPHPRREPSQEVMEVVRRGERKLIDEYLEQKRKRAS